MIMYMTIISILTKRDYGGGFTSITPIVGLMPEPYHNIVCWCEAVIRHTV